MGSGATVTVPAQVNRIADAWQAHNEVVAMLGAGDRMVATVLTKKLVPWLYTVNPQMDNAPTVFTNSTADVEALLAQRPDVVFLPVNSKVSDALVAGDGVTVGMEQILAWNPDVVILGSTTLTDPKDPQAAARTLLANPAWAGVNAIKNNKVLVNPVGAYYWDRYSAEGALQLLWSAKTLHPELFPQLDVAAETKAFYSRFLNYQLTDAQANTILTARNP